MQKHLFIRASCNERNRKMNKSKYAFAVFLILVVVFAVAPVTEPDETRRGDREEGS